MGLISNSDSITKHFAALQEMIMDRFTNNNGVQLHYLDYGGEGPALICLPGLTANAHAFDGVAAAGLTDHFHVYALDFRGRGLSDKPASGYSMADYAADVTTLLDANQLDNVILCGHSFGGLIAFVLASLVPERVSKLVIVDSSHLLVTEATVKQIKASLDRLGKRLPSLDAYLAAMRSMPFLDGQWDRWIEAYYRGDVQVFEDGSAQAWTPPHAIAETINHEYDEPWADHIAAIEQPCLLINAPAPFGPPGAPPILPQEMALATAAQLLHCRYVAIPGNHMTMLFGENAAELVAVVVDFAA
jgi:pimeloyl-ACP methyl ester carboxylesterase